MIAAKYNAVIELRLFGNEIFFRCFEQHDNLLVFFVNTLFVTRYKIGLLWLLCFDLTQKHWSVQSSIYRE